MSTLYDKTWPVNFAEQKILAKRTLDKIRDIAVRAQTVFLRQRIQPTRSEWETAYVSQTGGILPIPIGLKLIWFNLTKGECETFLATNDSFAGQSSSGNTLQQISTSWLKPSMKLLAYSDTSKDPNRMFGSAASGNFNAIHLIEASNSKNYIAVSLNANENYKWSLDGLESLYIFYKLRATVTTPQAVQIFFTSEDVIQSYFWYESPFSGTRVGQANYVATLGANTFTSTDERYAVQIAPGTGNPGSVAGAYATGSIFLENFTQRSLNQSGVNIPTDTPQAPAGVHIGGSMGTGFVTNQIFLTQGSMTVTDEYHQRSQFPTVNSPDNPQSSFGNTSSKVWLYGIFKGYTT